MSSKVRYIVMFIVLALLQVALFGNITYLSFICPYIYILFILALPLGFNRYVAMLLAFLLGFIVDMFSNTPGVHMCATVAVAYVRDFWIDIVVPHAEMGKVELTLKKIGFLNFIKYAFVLVLLHHNILFFAEAWTFDMAWFTMLKALVNAIITMLLILCYYLISKR